MKNGKNSDPKHSEHRKTTTNRIAYHAGQLIQAPLQIAYSGTALSTHLLLGLFKGVSHTASLLRIEKHHQIAAVSLTTAVSLVFGATYANGQASPKLYGEAVRATMTDPRSLHPACHDLNWNWSEEISPLTAATFRAFGGTKGTQRLHLLSAQQGLRDKVPPFVLLIVSYLETVFKNTKSKYSTARGPYQMVLNTVKLRGHQYGHRIASYPKGSAHEKAYQLSLQYIKNNWSKIRQGIKKGNMSLPTTHALSSLRDNPVISGRVMSLWVKDTAPDLLEHNIPTRNKTASQIIDSIIRQVGKLIYTNHLLGESGGRDIVKLAKRFPNAKVRLLTKDIFKKAGIKLGYDSLYFYRIMKLNPAVFGKKYDPNINVAQYVKKVTNYVAQKTKPLARQIKKFYDPNKSAIEICAKDAKKLPPRTMTVLDAWKTLTKARANNLIPKETLDHIEYAYAAISEQVLNLSQYFTQKAKSESSKTQLTINDVLNRDQPNQIELPAGKSTQPSSRTWSQLWQQFVKNTQLLKEFAGNTGHHPISRKENDQPSLSIPTGFIEERVLNPALY